MADCWGVAHCRQPTLSQGILRMVCTTRAGPPWASASFQQHSHHRRKELSTWQQSPLLASTPEWDRVCNPNLVFSWWVSQTQARSQAVISCGTAWDTAWRFQLQEATVWSPKSTPSTQHHRQYKSVDYTHSAKPALLLEISCQFSTGTGILVSMKLSWCWRAPRGLFSMRRMGLFWIVSTRSRWEKTKQNRRTKNNRHAATKC